MKQLSGFIELKKSVVFGPNNGPGVYLLTADPANQGESCLIHGFPLSKARGNQVTISAGANGLQAFWFDGAPGDKVIWLKVGGSGFGHNPAA